VNEFNEKVYFVLICTLVDTPLLERGSRFVLVFTLEKLNPRCGESLVEITSKQHEKRDKSPVVNLP
jgi:hypothetical protein